MSTSKLKETFLHLSQHSVDSVQNGKLFTEWDDYMHVDRPIESKLQKKMDEIDDEGGGIVLLVGSAGDGKSHLLSRIRQMSDWGEESFYNDATASSSPRKTAIETLKEALVDFNDYNLHSTSSKLVLAINLGKLNALIDDEHFNKEYKEIVSATSPIFDDDDTTPPIETDRVKVVMFVDQQIFEFHANAFGYKLESKFLSTIMEKIVRKSADNPFYKAYKDDIENGISAKDPLIINYKLLSIPTVRDCIVKTIIEAIVRFKMIITPREFLDFLYTIMVYPYEYKEKKNFYEALLPSLLFCGGDNLIQKAICKLDPLKHSSTDHDKQLSILFTSYSIPKDYFETEQIQVLPSELITRTNQFYSNNGRDIDRTTKFVFRLKHLLSYHSESKVYESYLDVLNGIYIDNVQQKMAIYDIVSTAIPRHYGSYYAKTNMVPLNIQGGRYRLFGNLKLKPKSITTFYSVDDVNKFLLRFDMVWEFLGSSVKLRMDYQLYTYLYELNRGKLALSYENEKNLTFGRFVRELVKKCDCESEITIVEVNSAEKVLRNGSFGNIELS